jgi:hypothetical protein
MDNPFGIGTRINVPVSGLNQYNIAFVRSTAGNTPAPCSADNIAGANPTIARQAPAPAEGSTPGGGDTTEPTRPKDPVPIGSGGEILPVTPTVSQSGDVATPSPGGLNNIPVIGNLLAGFDSMTLLIIIGAGFGIWYFAKGR